MWTLALLLACQGPDEAPAPEPQGPLQVRTLSFPVHYLAERLLGGDEGVQCVLPPGEDPPHWRPDAELVAGLQQVDLILANGAGFEAWTATASLPRSRFVETAANVQPIHLEGLTHSHGAGDHSHAGVDPHTWSDPDSYRSQAQAAHAALLAARPALRPQLDANLVSLEADLDTLSEALRLALDPARGRTLMASHPAFNYLGRRFNVPMSSFDFDPEQPLNDEQIASLQTALSQGAEPILLWEATPSEATRDSVPEQVTQLVLDPLEQPLPGARYDYFSQARSNVKALEPLAAALQGAP